MIDFTNVTELKLGNTLVERVTDSLGAVLWEVSRPEPEPANSYFYIEDISGSDNTLSITNTSNDVYCSTDRANWTLFNGTATIPANGKLYLKANINSWDGRNISASGNHNVGGNIMSLLYGDNFENQTSFPSGSNSNFAGLFVDNTHLISVVNLIFPATTLTDRCYNYMFGKCSSLTTAPTILPATTVTYSCYGGMFEDCSSLATAPVLPATTLADRCYENMFWRCASLTQAPALPATTLISWCYRNLFNSCTNLNTITTYATDIPDDSCLIDWVGGVSATGDFYNLGGATYAVDSPSGIPQGWTEHKWYNVAIVAGNNGSVRVNGVIGNYSQSVPSGTVLTIEGTGNTGYNFNEWSDGNTDNPRTITVTGDLTLTASFESAALPNYFYVEDTSGAANTLSITKSNANAPTIEVFSSTDQINWTSIGTTSTTAITATIPANSKLFIKATADSWALSSNNYNRIYCDSRFIVGGNVMSLLYGDNFEGQTSFPSGSSYNFTRLLYDNIYITDVSNIHLPATTLAQNCYAAMFQNCTSLTSAPELPATTLASSCYSGMFAGCTSLTQAPVLPATTLASSCYNSMFSGCTSLTEAPALPATTLAGYCYTGMFGRCTSLTTAPALPATNLQYRQYCYSSMFWGCTSLASAPVLPATTLTQACYNGMFKGCTSLTEAPALPATTLDSSCYNSMFSGCTSLTEAPALPATTLATSCYEGMFSGCTSLTTAPALPAITLQQWCYRNMFQNCSNLNSVTISANNISASNCLYNWLSDVAATGDFYNKGTATYTVDSGSGIPAGWTEHKWYNVAIVAGYNGSVRVNGVIGNYSQRVQSDTVLTIEGIPHNGYLFSTWSDGNTANPRTVTVNSNLYLSSTFATIPNYMYVEDVSGTANTLKIAKDNNDAPAIDLSYSTDAVNWTIMGNPSTTGFTTTIPANGRVYLKATADRWGNGGQHNYITANNDYNVGGNIMSLLYGDNFEGQTELPSGLSYHFSGLFRNETHLVSAEDLSMPATTLRNSCYESMFKGCTSLTTAPALPAQTLAEHCYQAMFQGCTSLNNVRVSADDISASLCTINWLDNVAATGDFYNNGTATYAVDSPSGIPQGWTEHKGTPDEYFWIENPNDSEISVDITTEGSAPAITLYYSTDKVDWQQSSGWVDIEPQSKVYMKANTDKWATTSATDYNHFGSLDDDFNVGGNIMSLLYGDNYKDVTTFGTNNTYAFAWLFYGSKVVDASQLKLPTNTVTSCYNGMFKGCTSLTTAPALPATTLNPLCYRQMFQGCTLLNKIVSYAEDASVAGIKTMQWLDGVSATGDFYNLGNAGYSSGVSGIPTGWTVHTSL